ncbi:MAG: CBS domain-containing protein [Proteobacteria bacterium]|nr:CBS domain-containing protein [Pseudomonadota bacterium]
MKVRDVMTAGVVTARPEDTIQAVARRMSEVDTGVIPIAEGDRVVGLITDRDIVLRIVAESGDVTAPVSSVMTTGVETVQADDSLKVAAKKMSQLQIRRLVVLGDDGRLAGILSLGDVALEDGDRAEDILQDVSDPGDRPA